MKSGKKVVFFTEPKWAFGSIHSSLCKILYPEINGEVLNFFDEYTWEEMKDIDANTDLWVTNWPWHLISKYGISPRKIAFIAHARWDLHTTLRDMPQNIRLDLNRISVISQDLSDYYHTQSMAFGCYPRVTRLGIHYDRFAEIGKKCPVTRIQNIGIMGAYESYNFFGEEIKRGRLVEETIRELNLESEFKFNLIRYPKGHYLASPNRYAGLDCVVMASTEEGGGLPMIEGAAAGRLCMGTCVGYHYYGGGIALPTKEEDFKTCMKEQLKSLNRSPNVIQYWIDCGSKEAQAFDWSNRRKEWMDFLLP